jgi:hypothetical protein
MGIDEGVGERDAGDVGDDRDDEDEDELLLPYDRFCVISSSLGNGLMLSKSEYET